MKEMKINLPDLRLNARYQKLVKEHIQHGHKTATGVSIPCNLLKSFSTTQAAWRFFSNDRVQATALIEPLRNFAGEYLQEKRPEYVLSVIDWSKITYKGHSSKKDLARITHKNDIGYELTSQLLVDAEKGIPIAPIQMHMKAGGGYLSTSPKPVPAGYRVEQISELMAETQSMKLSCKPVYIIDREADSVWHFRSWSANDELFLVRGSDRVVRWQGHQIKYSAISSFLESEGEFKPIHKIQSKGKMGILCACETRVTLKHPAKRKVGGRTVRVPGEPLDLRLVVTKVFDPQTGVCLHTWYLLTNVPDTVPAHKIASWYAFRWQIESYFKLMKSGGQEMEHWQQESGERIFKRLLVASMAAATVWQLQKMEDEESENFKDILVRLSGKSVKRGRAPTAGSLFSWLFVWLKMFDFLELIDFDMNKLGELRALAKKLVPHLSGLM